MEFTAIDFETANAHRSSACSVGIAVIRNGEIASRFYTLIKPPTADFNPFNIRRHRIRPELVADAPTFREIYPTLVQQLRGPVVAHNASFDIGVLRACVEAYDLAPPSLAYFCSLRLSQAKWPESPSHELGTLAKQLQIPLANHHNAQEDAVACANVVLRAIEDEGVASIEDLATALCVTEGRLAPEGHSPCRGGGVNRRSRSQMGSPEEAPIVHSTRLSGVVVLFTGLLDCMPREDAESKIRCLGGEVVKNVSGRVQIVVVGHAPGAKLTQAEARRNAGQQITFLDETGFLSLLEGFSYGT